MSTYILIHGAWQGGWCWNKVATLLEQAGHNVIAPDLPSHGNDQTPISEVTLQSYVDRVYEILKTQAEPVILVGHSMGGIVITQAAEYYPDKIEKLVYVCAFLPRNGESLMDWAQPDSEALVLPNAIVSEDRSYLTFKDEAIEDTFYGDCFAQDVAKSKSLLCPQALAPLQTPVNTTAANFGRVPRVYIECLQDRAISISVQRQMQAALPCHLAMAMDTSHSPFLSHPKVLVNNLSSL
ncbi:alpha/beta fold hydrolase [Nostoc sp.]|uniref:alpha/beta fold hydrolase n=1 Tax=Nostoc sp. TaxID=1180 RepID=UPI002FF74437